MSALKNLSWSGLTSIGGAVLDIGRIAILTRFLVPEDFGAFAIALVVVGFCQLFSESGIGNAIVSQEKVSSSQVGQLINISILVSFFICLIATFFTPEIAVFYDANILNNVLPLILLSIPAAAVSRIFQSMMQRHMEFKAIALSTLAAKLLGLGIALWAALSSLGIYALVWSALVSSYLALIFLFPFARKYILFTTKIQWKTIEPILRFSGFQLGEFLLNFFAKNFDVLLITKLLGTDVSGVYVICKNLLSRGGEIIVSTFSRYSHPTMAKVQTSRALLNEHYLCFFRSVSFLVVLVYLFIGVNNVLFVDLILGAKFTHAYGLILPMCIWLILRFCTAPVATLWLVRLKPELGVGWNILVAILVPSVIFANSDNGIQAILNSLIVLQLSFVVLSVYLTYRLMWCSKDFARQQILWLSTLTGCGGLYLLVLLTSYLGRYITFVGAICATCLFVLYAWRNRHLFLKERI